MATTIRDLIHLAEGEAAFALTSPARAEDCLYALAHLGRAVAALARDGVDNQGGTARGLLAQQLADSCTAAAAPVPRRCASRTSTVAGALGDLVASASHSLDGAQRWALVTTLAATVRRVTNYTADTAPLPSSIARTAARAVLARAVTDPPTVIDHRALDYAVPATAQPLGDVSIAGAAEALFVIAGRLRATAATGQDILSLAEIFAVTRAAESTTQHAVTALASLQEQPPPALHLAPASWRMIRTELLPFANVAPRQQSQDLTAWALHTHIGLSRGLGTSRPHQPPSLATVQHLQRMTNLLPDISDQLFIALETLADRRDLHAFARLLPVRESRLGEYLANKPIVGDRADLFRVRKALSSAGDCAAELAVTLNAAFGAATEEPGLLAAHARRAHRLSHPQAPADRWAPLVNAVAPTAVTDPHWPALATRIQRLHDAGGDIANLLALFMKDQPLPAEHPARSLDYRLSTAAPRPSTPPTRFSEAPAPIAAPPARPHSGPSRPRQSPSR